MPKGPDKHRRPWTEDDDNRLAFDWGVFNADTIAERLGRTVNSVIWRAKKLQLGPAHRGTISVGQLAEETGFHRDRVVNAARKLGVSIPKAPSPLPRSKRAKKGRRTALNCEAAEKIREFLRTYPDGASIIQHPATEWGVAGRPGCCNDCETTSKRHYAKGLCEACYKRERYYAAKGGRDRVDDVSYADMLEEALDPLVEVHQGSHDVKGALQAGGWVHVNVAGHTYEVAHTKMGVAVRKQEGGQFGRQQQYASVEDALQAIRLGDQADSYIIKTGS